MEKSRSFPAFPSRFLLHAALVLFGMSAPATWAAEVTFTGTGSSADWFTPANWSSGALPTTTGTATINLGRDALLSSGTSSIRALTITQNSNLTVSGSTSALIFTATFPNPPTNLIQSGTLAILNGARVTGTINPLALGSSGTATLLINGGTFTTYYAQTGINAGDLGIVNLTGSNSFWYATGGLTVGLSGSGTMSITNGARLLAPSSAIAQNDGSTGAVVISGTGSVWDTNGAGLDLASGANSVATLRIENGGLLTLTGNNTASNLNIAGGVGSSATVIQTSGTVTIGELRVGSGTGIYRLEGGVLETAYITSPFGGSYILELASGTVRAFAPNPLDAQLNATLRAGTTSSIDTNGFAGTWSGTVSGSGALNKIGTNTLTLSANNSYTGGTTLTRGGILFGHNNAIGTGTLSIVGDSSFGATGGARTIANNIVINSGFTGTVIGTANSLTLTGTMSGDGTLTKIGTGTLTLSGSNTYTGNTALNGGTLFFGHDQAIGTGTLTLSGSSSNFGALNASRTIANNIVINTGITGTVSGSAALTLNGTISGAGGLTKTGTTTLTAGAIVVANAGAFGSSAALVFNGGTLQGNGSPYTFSSSVSIAANTEFSGLSDLTFTGNTNLGTTTRTLVVNNGTTAFSGTLTNTAGLTKTGTGTLLLSETANTYTGKTTVNSGTLAIAAPGSLGNPGAANAAIDLGATSTTAALRYLGATGTIARTINLAGSTGGAILDASGSGALTLSGSLTGSVAGAKTLTLTGTNTGLNSVSGTISNGSGTVSLLKSGNGTWRLTSTNTYSGSTNVAGGLLIVSSTAHLGTATSAIALGAAATSGTLSYSGNSGSFTRGFTVAAGGGGIDVASAGQTLTIATSGIATSGTLTFSGSGNTTVASALTGAGSLRKTGSGLLSLTGSNSYLGGTRVSSGTLAAQNNHAVGSGPVVVDGGVFYVDSGVTVSNAVILSGGAYDRTLSGSLVDSVNASSDLPGGIDTTARLAAGSSASTILHTSFSADSDATNDGLRRSDIYTLEGTGSNIFVLELSFTSTQPGSILAWLNGDNQWVNAIDGNSDNNATAAQQGFAGTFAQFQAVPGNGTDLSTYIGAYGVNTSGGITTAWAVLDHNSDFAIIPEPTTLALLAAGLAAFAPRRRKP